MKWYGFWWCIRRNGWGKEMQISHGIFNHLLFSNRIPQTITHPLPAGLVVSEMLFKASIQCQALKPGVRRAQGWKKMLFSTKPKWALHKWMKVKLGRWFPSTFNHDIMQTANKQTPVWWARWWARWGKGGT